MYIDDNIPADNYCGIILKAEQQEDTDIYGNVKWRRIYLWVDIAKGLYKVTSKNPQKYRPIEAFSIIGQILTCKQCFEKVTLP